MRIGVFYFPADYGINLAELARALEDRGFDSLFVPEHTHIPLSRQHAVPRRRRAAQALFAYPRSVRGLGLRGGGDQEALLGTGICLVPQHDPIVTAKAIASLDQLSGGRFVFGIGAGWNADEMENHGVALRDALQGDARARAGHEGAVDRGRGVVPRRVREVRSGVVVAQAPAAPASADHSGRRERPYAAPRDQLLRRLVPAPARRLRRRPGGRAVASDGDREGTQSLDAARPSCSARANDAKVLEGYEKAGIQSALLAVPDEGRDEILRYLDKIAPLAKLGVAA